MGLLRKLTYSITKKLLISIHKAFLRSCLDYCDVIYDKTPDEKLTDTLESIQ